MAGIPPKITSAIKKAVGEAKEKAREKAKTAVGGKRGPRGSTEPKQRVIRVDAAIRCCELAKDRVLSTITDIAVQLLDRDPTQGLAFAPVAPSVAPTGTGLTTVIPTDRPQFIRVNPLGGLAAGAIMIFTAERLRDIEKALGTASFAESLVDMERAIRIRTAKTTGDCSDCMMRRALGQTNPRQTVKLANGDEMRLRA